MKYSVWITITIEHTYFNSGECGLELNVTDDSAMLMKKTAAIFRKRLNNQWIILMLENENGMINPGNLFPEDSEQLLTFTLNEKSDEFFYYTDWSNPSIQGTDWMIGHSDKLGRNRRYLQLRVTPAIIKEARQINITIPGREARWEFILIPKYNDDKYPIVLKEKQDKLMFSAPEEIMFPGERIAFRCVSTELIAMKEKYDYKISLWQKRGKGDVLLSDHIPCPRPHSLSISNPKEMITSYFYF